jgi:hypothetical protein
MEGDFARDLVASFLKMRRVRARAQADCGMEVKIANIN